MNSGVIDGFSERKYISQFSPLNPFGLLSMNSGVMDEFPER